MTVIKRITVVLLLLIAINKLSAQERYGMSNSVYAGINGMWLNPACIVHSPFKWDFNFFTINPYVDNNYLYIYKANLPELIKDQKHPKIISNNYYNKEHNNYTRYMIYDNNNTRDKTLYGSLFLQGPSLMVSFADLLYGAHERSNGNKQSVANAFSAQYAKKWSFAISTAIRGSVSVNNLDYKTADLFYQGMNEGILKKTGLQANDFKFNMAMWDEFSFSLGREIYHNKHYKMKGALTYKYLMANTGAYFHNKVFTPYFPNYDDASFSNFNATYGHAISDPSDNFYMKSVGTGHAFDLGVIFMDKLNEDASKCKSMCDEVAQTYYKWQVGVSLLDLGAIKYKTNASTYNIEKGNAYWANIWETKFQNFKQFDDSIGYYFYDDTIAKPNGTSFSMGMPSALSVQFDYNLGTNFFINATLVQRTPFLGDVSLYRANSLAITPRFDYKRFGVAIPIVMYNYTSPRIGAAIRLNNNLIVGTDRLGTYFGNQLYGADIYVSLKLNNLRKCHNYYVPAYRKRTKKISSSESTTKQFIKPRAQSSSQNASGKFSGKVRAGSSSVRVSASASGSVSAGGSKKTAARKHKRALWT